MTADGKSAELESVLEGIGNFLFDPGFILSRIWTTGIGSSLILSA
jgi:hypothetical protein